MKTILKICKRCDLEKEARLLSNGKGFSYCLDCTHKYNIAHYASHSDEGKQRARQWAKDNKQRKAETYSKWRENNKDRMKQIFADWHIANRESVLKRQAEWRLANPERAKELTKAWRDANPDKARAIRNSVVRRYQTNKLKRCPPWLSQIDVERMRGIYLSAQRLTEETKERWEVDHIFPLQGRLVSGLHVPDNLRVIRKSENARKSNSFVVE